MLRLEQDDLSRVGKTLFMAVLWNRAGHYIFALWFISSSFFLSVLSSPNLNGRRLDVYVSVLTLDRYFRIVSNRTSDLRLLIY